LPRILPPKPDSPPRKSLETTDSRITLKLDSVNFEAGVGIYAITEYKIEFDGGAGNETFVNLRIIPV
jgi:hypothetical protein